MPSSIGEPSFRLACDGVLEAVKRLWVAGGAVVDTAILNVSLADWPAGSLADVLTLMVPTFADVGVPLNVWVDAVNVSHEGSGVPSANVAA